MRFKNPEFAVGLFALVGLGIIIFLSTQVSSYRSLNVKTNHYFAQFESVSGLIPKISVEVAGIISGYVDTIELVDGKAQLKVQINKKIAVHEDAILFVKDRGVLGDRYVVLFPGSEDKPLIENGGVIQFTHSQSDFEKLSKNLADVSVTIRQLLEDDDPQGALGQTIKNLRDVTGKLNEWVGNNQENMSQITENLRSLTEQINGIALDNRDQVKTLIASLNETAATIKNVVEKIDEGQGSLGQLINDDSTVTKLNETLDGVNNTLGLFSRVQLKFRYRGEILMSQKEFQNNFGIMIAPGPDKYILVEFVNSPQGETVVTDTIINSGGTSTSTQTIQTKTGLTFTLMFAKRFWDTTFRVGFIRSQGGAGIDYHLFKDRLILTGEMFDLSRPNNKPVVRLYGTLYAYKHFLITGGVDDLLNEVGGKNPFFGLGLQFTDNDFRALLPVLGGGLN